MTKSAELPTYQRVLITTVVTLVFIWLAWLVFVKMQKKESAFAFPPNTEPNGAGEGDPEVLQNDDLLTQTQVLPGLFQLKYRISMEGKRSVFPMIIEKITPGPIELPNRRSLLNKDAKYKFVDIMPGEKIKIVSIQYLTYTVDHKVFNDDFLVTDNDYLIAFSQAKEHFKTVV